MEIGEILKAYRNQKKLTQKEFIRDVVSESYYSKVENGMHRINAEDLFRLLKQNQISLTDFADQLYIFNEENSLTLLENKLYVFFYNNQMEELDILVTMAKQDSTLSDDEKELFFALIDILKELEDSSGSIHISEQNKKMLKDKILEDENWTNRSMMLFANTLHIYDFEDTTFLLQSLLRKRLDYDFTGIHNDNSIIFATILLNYVSICIGQKELHLTRKPLQVLNKMPKTPEYTFYRLMLRFYIEMIDLLVGRTTSRKNILAVIDSFKLIDRLSFSDSLYHYAKTHIPTFEKQN